MTLEPDKLSALYKEALHVIPHILAHDIGRYVIGAGGVFLIVNGALSHLLAGRRIRAERPGGAQIKREIFASLRTAVIFAMVGMGIWITETLGFAKFYKDPSALGWAWFWISLVIVILAHDAWFYWTHRVIHHPRLFRMFHKFHHRSNNPTPFTSYSFDWPEAVVNGVFLLLIGLIIPISFLASFIFTAHMMLRNAIGHCGYELFPRTKDDRPRLDWLTTVTHHDLHHAEAGWNYGLYFTFWDRLMGTEHPDYYARFKNVVTPKPVLGSLTKTKGALHMSVIAFIFYGTVFGAGLALGTAKAQETMLAAMVTSTSSQNAKPFDTITGQWATQGYGAVVSLAPCATNNNTDEIDTLCGTLVWAWDSEEIDQSAIGELMLWGFSFDKGAWRNGRLKNPEDGRSYRGVIIQRNTDVLDLKGCTARIICQSQTWRRLESLPHMRTKPEQSSGLTNKN